MKSSFSPPRCLAIVGAVICVTSSVGLAAEAGSPAAEQKPATTPAEAPAAPSASTSSSTDSESASVKLPYGVDDVLKLSRAQISEGLIQNFIQNSGTIYTLTPKEIVYLRNEGVSDKVLNTMLEQRKRATEAAEQAAQQATKQATTVASTADASAYADANVILTTPVYAEPYPAYTPTPYFEAQPNGSTLYVISYPPARAAYYGHYTSFGPHYPPAPSYGGFYRYPRVGVSTVHSFGGNRGFRGRHR